MSLLTLAIANVSAAVAFLPSGPPIPAAPVQTPSSLMTAAITSGAPAETLASRTA